MNATLMIEQLNCPFLRPRLASRVYCRLPSGRVRIPSSDELARLCTRGRYNDCPVFRRVRSHEMDLTGLM
jgi:hypothetical protein